MGRRLDVQAGTVFGRLTVLREVEGRIYGHQPYRRMECQCQCGKIITANLTGLRAGHPKSCGCLHADVAPEATRRSKTTHGQRRTPLYKLWCDIKQRCGNSDHPFYARYGGRGITVYESWITDFVSFATWMNENLGPRPHNYTLDRINNDGSYEPGNLRWATRSTQCKNQERWKDPQRRRDALTEANKAKRRQHVTPAPHPA